jgi:hypothetical protein
MKDLAILICHTPDRYDFMKRLSEILDPQLQKHKNNVVCISDDSRYKTIGRKRNDLVARANAKYYCFADDDDLVSHNYIDLLMEGVHKDVDCCSLKGIITEDGKNPLIFEHSIKYHAYRTNEHSTEGQVRYERYPNHLNVVRTEIGKQFKFPEKNFGEDTDYATQLYKSQLVKTEHYISQIIYRYEYRRRK